MWLSKVGEGTGGVALHLPPANSNSETASGLALKAEHPARIVSLSPTTSQVCCRTRSQPQYIVFLHPISHHSYYSVSYTPKYRQGRTTVMEQGADHAGLQAQVHPEQQQLDSLEDNLLEEVLNYAYENDLVRDYRLESFSLTHLFGKLIQSTIPTTTDDGFTGCAHLTALELPNPTPRGEKPNATDSALRLVCETRRELSDEEVKNLTGEVCNDGNISGLKLELPILRTDNSRDMKDFQREMLSRQDLQKEDHRIPFEPIDVSAGEGLELPAEAQLETEAFLRKLEGEKFRVTIESTRYLVGSLRAEATKEDRRKFVQRQIGDIEYRKVCVGIHNHPDHLPSPTCMLIDTSSRFQHRRSWSFRSAQSSHQATLFPYRMRVSFQFPPIQALRF